MPEKMFLDFLVEKYSRDLSPNTGLSLSPKQPQGEREKFRKGALIDILNKSHLFLVNGAVVDDLYNIPPEATNYEALFHLPFNSMFFEFMNPLIIDRPMFMQN